MMRKFSTQRGFTFIELLIVIALIGILAAGLLLLIDPAAQLRKGRDVQRKSDLRQIQAGLELYRADQDTYPLSLPSCGSALAIGGATYLQQIPCDPRNTGNYVYHYTPTGTTYTLTACLENVTDAQKDTTNNNSYCTGGTTNWSYTVINP